MIASTRGDSHEAVTFFHDWGKHDWLFARYYIGWFGVDPIPTAAD